MSADDGQGLLPFMFDASARPMDLTAQAGLTLVAETMLALGLDGLVRDELRIRSRKRGYEEFDSFAAIVLLLAAGGDRVEDIRVLARDEGLVRLLSRPMPSPDALHAFLARFHDETTMRTRPADGAWIAPESDALAALGRVNTELLRRATIPSAPSRATLDLDATIIESHKRDALAHYKGGRGFQPTAVLWAEQDLVVADQFRDGNVPAGMRTLEVAQRAFAALPVCISERFFRADSACYDEALLKWLMRERIAFSISADMTRQLRAECARHGVRWEPFEDRSSERVELSEVEFTPGDWPKNAAPLRYVAIRFSGKQGRLFADGADVKYLAVVSNRRDPSAAALVRWHWQKAGTIELLHDVSKNELGAHLMPSARLGANAAWYRLALISYNVLSILRRHALPERLESARPKRLRFELFTVPAEIRSHARRLHARLGAPQMTIDELIAARGRLRALHDRVLAQRER